MLENTKLVKRIEAFLCVQPSSTSCLFQFLKKHFPVRVCVCVHAYSIYRHSFLCWTFQLLEHVLFRARGTLAREFTPHEGEVRLQQRSHFV